MLFKEPVFKEESTETKSHRKTIAIKPDLRDEAIAYAKKTRRSFSALVAMGLEEVIKKKL